MKNPLLIALLLCAIIACNKTKAPVYDLPQYEAALINGRAFRGVDSLNLCYLTAPNDTITKFELAISNGKAGNLNTTITANYVVKKGNKLKPEGVYTNVNPLAVTDKYCVFYLKMPVNGALVTRTSFSGKLEITSADETTKRVTGKYNFSVANNGDTIVVTNGTFINSKYLLEK
ncbi:MAG: hypothetical protein H7331_12075 [Bacteroidia bacterium]|nr:hypothetical protein [Bacteroidia bacterium]